MTSSRWTSRDAVSDSGREEIWNLLEERGIDNVILMGVHANMCVLGRPFGLRQLAKNGKQVVLMRDMTDTMYNPARWPHVGHFRGTDLIVEHVEKYVCPTITSDQILESGRPFRFRGDIRPRAVLAISEDEYKTERTLPEFVRDMVQDRLGVDVRILLGAAKPPHDLPGLAAALEDADLLLVSMRRRSLPAADLQAARKFITAGKPVVGIRTASHAFDARGQLANGRAVWPEFGAEILGCNYSGHHDSKTETTVIAVQESDKHPILTGVRLPLTGHSSHFIKVSPLAKTAIPLLTGSIPNQPGRTDGVGQRSRPVAGFLHVARRPGGLPDGRLPPFAGKRDRVGAPPADSGGVSETWLRVAPTAAGTNPCATVRNAAAIWNGPMSTDGSKVVAPAIAGPGGPGFVGGRAASPSGSVTVLGDGRACVGRMRATNPSDAPIFRIRRKKEMTRPSWSGSSCGSRQLRPALIL